MQRYWLLVIILWASAAQAETLLVVGDSIGAGFGIPADQNWVALLRDRIQPSGWQVVNASRSGETTTGGLARLDNLLQRHQPDFTILELGGNDAMRGVSPAAIGNQLDSMLQRIQQSGSDAMLIGVTLPPNYGSRRRKAFEQMFVEVAEETDTVFVSFAHTQAGTDNAYLQIDRIHPNRRAQPILSEAVWNALAPHLKLQ